MNDRLDDTQIEQLHAWALRLAANGDDELRAAGKAILLLIGEIERVHAEAEGTPPQEPPEPDAQPATDDGGEPTMERTLRSRLSRLRNHSAA